MVVAAARGAGCWKTPYAEDDWTPLTTTQRASWTDGLLIEGVAGVAFGPRRLGTSGADALPKK